MEIIEGYEFLRDILSFLCSIFVMIVMLNLLIAIISDFFDKVQQNQVNEYFQEKASIIAENSYLIPSAIKNREDKKPGKLILIAAKVGFNNGNAEEDDQF